MTLKLSSPDGQSPGWSPSSRSRIEKFGLYGFTSATYPVRFYADWMRLPGSGWFPYDQSRYAFRADWWGEYCGRLLRNVHAAVLPDGVVIEGWNESDRFYTVSGDEALKAIMLQMYEITADTFSVVFGDSPMAEMASLSFTDPKESALIHDFLDKVVEDPLDPLPMDLFGTHSYRGAPNTALEIARLARAALDDYAGHDFSAVPIYLGAYMDYFHREFRKDRSSSRRSRYYGDEGLGRKRLAGSSTCG